MKRIQAVVIGLVCLLALGTFGNSAIARAQDDFPEGITSVYMRGWGPEFLTSMEGSPVPGSTPIDMAEIQAISLAEMTFSTEDQAAAAMDSIPHDLATPAADGGVSGVTYDGLGDQAYEMEDNFGDTSSYGYFVRDGNQILLVSIRGMAKDDALEAGRDLITYVMDHEPQTDEVIFHEDGTSTGGFHDRLPPVGDPLLLDLVPWRDGQGLDFSS